MKGSWLWTLGTVLALAAGSYAAFVATRPAPLPPGFLYGSGHVEGTEIRVAAEVGGRVVAEHMIEGSRVAAGDTLVVIEPDTARDRLQLAQSALAAREETRAVLQAQLATWLHHAETAARQVERLKTLAGSSLVAEQALDEAENTMRNARGEVAALRRRLAALAAELDGLRAEVRLAETALAKTRVVAPAGGTVLIRAVEAGEFVQAGQPVAVLVDLRRLELRIYVPERELAKIALGAGARVRVDGYPDEYFAASVARVDQFAQFTPRDIHLPEERTRMVYGVTLALENPQERLKPGMPADAWIRWDPAVPWPDRLPVPAP